MIPRALIILPLIVIGCQSPVDLSPGPTRPVHVIESNILRASNTLRGNRPSLIRVASLDRAARQQAQAMTRSGGVFHSAASGTFCSRRHNRNLLDRKFRKPGIGLVRGGADLC